MRTTKKATSIKAVAKHCCVSAMTVSRALRQDPSVAEETRERIVAAAEQLGYRPRAKQGRPRQRRHEPNPTIDIVLSLAVAPASMFKTELLVSIEQELSGRGYDCIVRTVGNEYDQFLSLYEQLQHSNSRGTLLIGHIPVEQLKTILELKPDAILVDHTGDPRLPASHQSVGFDNVEAARIAVRHLIEIGRRRIALVKGAPDHFFSRDIERGYREVQEEAGLKVKPSLIRHGGFSAEETREAIIDLLDEGVPFDAVFTSDEMALGVLRALHERGLACPDDVAVAGCDGLPIGLQLIPTLTTVKLDYRQLGRIAVERVLAAGEAEAVPCRIRLLPELEIRESTSPLPKK